MTNVKRRRFMMTAHLLHKVNIEHSPDRRTDIHSHHGRTSTKVADGEEYCSEDEEYGVPDDSKGASEPPFMLAVRACLTPEQEKKVLEKVEEIQSDLPLFVAIINKSNVHQRGGHISPVINFGSQYTDRYLGENFAASHHREKSSAVNLVLQREGKSGSWPIKLRLSMRLTSRYFRVIKGWPSFARENRLREGDLCLFKLMKNEEPLKMFVYIIRRDKC
uniref:Uncharacterized protein n=1 Tax=Avena sativa TaxID=4498 RepID=A0ACD5XFM4_AVESA